MRKKSTLLQKVRAAILAIIITAASSQPAAAQTTYVEGDLGSFVSFVCGNFPTTNLAQVLQDLLNQLEDLRNLLYQTGSTSGGIGDPLQCLPGFKIFDLPSLPGIGDFSACLDFTPFAGIGSSIGACLDGVMSSFPDLDAYFSQYQWDLTEVAACLQSLVTLPTITIPDFLTQLEQTLDNLIAILQSARINLPVYDGFYRFFSYYCQYQYSSDGGMMGGSSPGFSSTVTQSGGTLSMGTVMIGGISPGAALAPLEVFAKVKGPRGTKKYPLSFRSGKYTKKVKLSRSGTYAVTIYVMSGSVPAAITQASIKY